MGDGSCKADLLAKIEAAHQKLEDALDGLSAAEMSASGASGEWAVKDILVHLAFWEQNLLRLLEYRLRGEDPPDPLQAGEDGLSWVARVNEENYRRGRTRPVDEVLAEFGNSYRQIVGAIRALPEEEAAPGGRLEQLLCKSIDRFFAADTYEHYQEHTQSIRSWRAGPQEAQA